MISRCRNSGFTLVEVMVALSILSLVLLGTVTGLRTLGNTQAALERKTVRVEEVRSVSGLLRDLMESAVVGRKVGALTLGGGSREATYFYFDEQYVEWKTTILFGEAFGGSFVVRVAHEGEDLVLRWLDSAVHKPDSEVWDKAPSRILVRDLEQFGISLRQDYHTDWTDEWSGGDPPALVRMQIKSSGRYWPDLIMQVQR
jgi:general secretion pathway protein J